MKLYNTTHVGETYLTREGYICEIINSSSKNGYCTVKIEDWVAERTYSAVKKGQVSYPYRTNMFMRQHIGEEYIDKNGYKYKVTNGGNKPGYVEITFLVYNIKKEVRMNHITLKQVNLTSKKLYEKLPLTIISEFLNSRKRHCTAKCPECNSEFTTRICSIANNSVYTCPTCSQERKGHNRSIYKNKKTAIYVLELINGLYKVGITQVGVHKRYQLYDKSIIKKVVLEQWFYDGVIPWDLEKKTLKAYREHSYKGEQMFRHTKNKEILTVNPLDFIIKGLNNV